VTSHTTKRFRKLLAELPAPIRKQAREAYLIWARDPWHGSLQFKQIHTVKPIYSVRVGLDWRAVCLRNGENVIWYWIGSHSEYDKIISQL
jgi:hypothetical protein